MSKREKYQYAIHCLEEVYSDMIDGGSCDANIWGRRRRQLRDAIVALGGESPDAPPDGSGGGPGEP